MKRPRRLLLTLNTLDMSGVAFSTQNLAAGLLQRNVHLMILAREGREREPLFHALKTRLTIARHFGTPLLGRGALADAQGFGPEAVLAQDLDVAPQSQSLAHALCVPLIVTVNRFDEEAFGFFGRHPDTAAIAVSEAVRERLINRGGIDRSRVQVIPNGLDLSQFPAPRFEPGPEKGPVPVIGTYGTLTEQKGQATFLQAAAEVVQQGIDAEFLIMGHGPDKPRLRKLTEQLGIRTRVTFTPSTSKDNRHLGNIDLFVEPSYQEGLGLSVLQAMASGVPVVASGVGGIFSLIEDGETGKLVPKGDAHALAEAIRELLANPMRRLDMARHARERVEAEFSAGAVADAVLDFCATRLSAGANARE